MSHKVKKDEESAKTADRHLMVLRRRYKIQKNIKQKIVNKNIKKT